MGNNRSLVYLASILEATRWMVATAEEALAEADDGAEVSEKEALDDARELIRKLTRTWALLIVDVEHRKITGPANLQNEYHVRACRACGCVQEACRACIAANGEPCEWVEDDLCSRCAKEQKKGRKNI